MRPFECDNRQIFMNAIELSIVTPMFNEESMIDIFFERVTACLEPVTDNYEIICVNDGSSDTTWQRLVKHAEQNPRIKAVNLSRNFGKEAALTAGLDMASGMAAIPFDADLQDPPELIAEMVEQWRKGFDVVLAKRVDRSADSLLKRSTSSVFYKVIDKFSDTRIPENVGDFRLLDRKVLECLKLFPEKSRFMKGIFASLGFNECVVEYARPERAAGETKWNYVRLYGLAVEGFVSFTSLPLKVWSYIGVSTAFGAFAFGLYMIVRTLVSGVDVPGYASLMVVVLFMSGLILTSLGMIGEYLARVFIEVKQRPIYLVMDTVGFDDEKKAHQGG
ncbi:putative glycosyltransferase [BD1-7 clade bacterium]|uniref:Putative glycosyltransferase n=1 Tax=BD1-7 clade bacterium TaxID=2029982 RepID=A0A5S9PNB7_9GAMM|nr:putative glycosyltransferase [BD1-7 clade bacterium]